MPPKELILKLQKIDMYILIERQNFPSFGCIVSQGNPAVTAAAVTQFVFTVLIDGRIRPGTIDDLKIISGNLCCKNFVQKLYTLLYDSVEYKKGKVETIPLLLTLSRLN